MTAEAPPRAIVSRKFAVRALLVTAIAVNAVLVAITIIGFFVSDAGYDWAIYVEAGRRAGTAGLYDWGGIYAWSYAPPFAYLFAAIAPIGYVGWCIAHVAALGLLRDLRAVALVFFSWPFWADLYNGNTMVFVFVAAYWTLRGSSLGAVSFVTLAVLMPRPVMIPILAWLLWKRPGWRLRFIAVAMTMLALVLVTGDVLSWIEVLIGVPGAVGAGARDLGPARIIGTWWLPIAALLAIVLTLRGRLGLASIAASPYWLPQYLLMGLLELVPSRAARPPSELRS